MRSERVEEGRGGWREVRVWWWGVGEEREPKKPHIRRGIGTERVDFFGRLFSSVLAPSLFSPCFPPPPRQMTRRLTRLKSYQLPAEISLSIIGQKRQLSSSKGPSIAQGWS